MNLHPEHDAMIAEAETETEALRAAVHLALAVIGSLHPDGTDPYVLDAERKMRAALALPAPAGESSDERAAFDKWRNEFVNRTGFMPDVVDGWKARAALAAPAGEPRLTELDIVNAAGPYWSGKALAEVMYGIACAVGPMPAWANAGHSMQRMFELASERVLGLVNIALAAPAASAGEPAAARELERLRAFAFAIMEDWPDVGIDGADLQELGIKHGLLELKMPKPTEPCSENCNCAAYFAADEWTAGIECYRLTALLTAPCATAPAPAGEPTASSQGEAVVSIDEMMELAYKAAQENIAYWRDLDPDAQRWVESKTYASLRAAITNLAAPPVPVPDASLDELMTLVESYGAVHAVTWGQEPPAPQRAVSFELVRNCAQRLIARAPAPDAEIERLRKALRTIAAEDGPPWPESDPDYGPMAVVTARVALRAPAPDAALAGEPTAEMLEAAGKAYMETPYRPIYAAVKAALAIAAAPRAPALDVGTDGGTDSASRMDRVADELADPRNTYMAGAPAPEAAPAGEPL